MRFESGAAWPAKDCKPAVEVRATGVRESFRQGPDVESNRFCRLFEPKRSASARPEPVPGAVRQFRNV
jgi:hypothetical protein